MMRGLWVLVVCAYLAYIEGAAIDEGMKRECAAPAYDYGQVLEYSLKFYEAQRSGKLPSDNRIPYRGDSAMNDGQSEGHDLTGGYYDAGDFVKFGFPMAASITNLAWGMIDYGAAYEAAGQMEWAYKTIKWGTDYFLKAHVSDNEFFGQCGDGNADHGYWGRPEEMTMGRPCWSIRTDCPGSELAAETAAALAAASVLFKTKDPSYSETCLAHAEKLYTFAKTSKGMYHDCITNAANFYRSWSGYWDELAWASAWLYKITNNQQYLTDADDYMMNHGVIDAATEFSWDSKHAGAQVILYEATNDDKYIAGTKELCDNVVDPNLPPKHTPKGLPYFSQWGSLRYAANGAFLCLKLADTGVNTASYTALAEQVAGYILGDTGHSYVCGFGTNPPTQPHHRSSSCPTTGTCDWNNFNYNGPNPQILYGALVGGPNDQDAYTDSRSDYVANEVATDYNAAFSGLIAGLSQAHMKNCSK